MNSPLESREVRLRRLCLFKAWKKELKRLGLPGRRMYDTRHTHTTHMLESGMPLKTVQQRLGHSRPDITQAIYTHVQEGKERKAVGEVEGKLGYLTRKAS